MGGERELYRILAFIDGIFWGALKNIKYKSVVCSRKLVSSQEAHKRVWKNQENDYLV